MVTQLHLIKQRDRYSEKRYSGLVEVEVRTAGLFSQLARWPELRVGEAMWTLK
jgi:hypothetical protein